MFSGKQEHNPHVAHWPGVTVLEDKEDRYRTVKKLGDGITATVYEGVSRADGGHYALKCINNKYLKDDDEAVEALRTEVATLRQLGSRRFIMSLHEVISTPRHVRPREALLVEVSNPVLCGQGPRCVARQAGWRWYNA